MLRAPPAEAQPAPAGQPGRGRLKVAFGPCNRYTDRLPEAPPTE